MDEVLPDEVQTERAMWMSERITALQNENEELKRSAQEMAAKIELHQRGITELGGRFGEMQKGIAKIVEHVQHQNAFNQSAKTSIDELVDEAKAHQKNFQELRWFSRTTSSTSQTAVLWRNRCATHRRAHQRQRKQEPVDCNTEE